MNARACLKIAGLLLLSHGLAAAQVSLTEPRQWKSASPVGLGSSGFGSDRDLREAVRREILDTNTIGLIAQSVHLSEHDRTLLCVAPGPVEDEVWLYSLSNEWGEGCGRFVQRLDEYVTARMDGHTKGCLLTGMTNRSSPSANSDSDLLILLNRHPILPASWLHKANSGTTTNKAGAVVRGSTQTIMVDGRMQLRTNYTHIPRADEVCRWVSYTIADGDVAWKYFLSFRVDGTLDRITDNKLDAKELDPKFRQVIKEVDSEVTAEMKRSGMLGQFGSVHAYWRLKREKLKARGIDWRSPAELNTGTIYD